MRAALLLILPFIGCLTLMYAFPNPIYNAVERVKRDSTKYEVYKIDSINSYYIIYAKQGNKLFKIISKKTDEKNNRIGVGKVYKLKLHSLLFVNGHSIIPANQSYEVSGWKIDDSTTISFEGDSIRDLFYADNLKGLVLKRN